MFPEIKKQKKKLPDKEGLRILKEGEYGFLATHGINDYPYITPLNYYYSAKQKAIYFHCALEGLKIDNILKNHKVCFCVVDYAHVIPDQFTTEYKSVIVFGTAKTIDKDEKQQALEYLLHKYSNDFMEKGLVFIKNQFDFTRVVKIKIEHISAKGL